MGPRFQSVSSKRPSKFFSADLFHCDFHIFLINFKGSSLRKFDFTTMFDQLNLCVPDHKKPEQVEVLP